MMILNLPSGYTKSLLVFPPFLSGKKLFSIQTFRDIFNSEVIQSTEGIGLANQTP